MVFRKLSGVLLLCLAMPAAFGQAAPQAQVGGIPLTVGAGYSNFDSDWHNAPGHTGTNRIMGYTIWVDWTFYSAPGALRGIGIELEGRELNWGRSSGGDPRLRQATGLGGLIYKWRGWRVVQPYGKLLAGYGGMNMTTETPGYTHNTRTVFGAGGGIDFAFHDNFIVRGDFEYQSWPNWMNYHSLSPHGFTIGAAWDFKRHPR